MATKKDVSKAVIELLKVATKNYPDSGIEDYFNMETGKEKSFQVTRKMGGDTLALFIGREIHSLYDPSMTMTEFTEEVTRALGAAIEELSAVRDAVAAVENPHEHESSHDGCSDDCEACAWEDKTK